MTELATRTVSLDPANGIQTDISFDVRGRPKVINDFSIFHGLFTFDIPKKQWLTYENGVEVDTSTRAVSTNGAGVISSGATLGDICYIRSKRHPRYQPNRGHLFSTALYFPVPTAIGIRQIGLKNTINGAYFQLEDGKLYAVVLGGNVVKVKQELDLSICDIVVADLQYGHLYDIQFQRRGVGDYLFYIDQKLVFKTSFLGTTTELTITNPAMGACFYCENTNGTQVSIKIGCVDISSEGGKREGQEYVSVSNVTPKAVNTANYPVVIVRNPNTFNALPNTRDTLALRCTGSSDQRAYMKAYVTRDITAITGASFVAKGDGSCFDYDLSATAINTALCKLLRTKRIEINASETVDLPSGLIDFYVTPGDYLIITCERDSPTQTANVIVTIEFGEEV